MKRPRPPKGTGEHSWEEYHRKVAEYEAWQVEQRNRRDRHKGGFVRSAITTAGIVSAVASTGAELLPGGQEYAQASEWGDWGETSLIAERNRQEQDMDEATRDAGKPARLVKPILVIMGYPPPHRAADNRKTGKIGLWQNFLEFS